MEKKILVVDDENAIADLLCLYLTNEGFHVFTCYDGESALAVIENEQLDLAVLDVMLPGIDGLALCRKIREHHHYPVIMLTAKEEEIDKINGLTMGADDYITKPFRPLELIARIKAQLRRFTVYNPAQPKLEADMISIRGLVIDKMNHKCILNEQELSLTPTEFSILWILCRHQGQVMSSDKLFYEVWGEKYYSNSNNTIMVHIRHIREKMKDPAERPKYIKTVWGVGYIIEK